MKYKLLPFILLLSTKLLAQVDLSKINPEHYICYRTNSTIRIDGLFNESDWNNALWTKEFIDIEGRKKPNPAYQTKVKMLWDDTYLYIAAYLEEPHVWATLTERESVIFYDNDFEVFLDPDGDTHKYLEFEMNALNTQWDLMLLKPYRDEAGGNIAIDNWNFNGIRSAVHIDGTLNNPEDIDKGWSVEIAIPLDAITEVGTTGPKPKNNEKYRINFSRVQWTTDIIDGKYVKRKKIENGVEKTLPEDNWVWSEQGVIAMHQPETWGYVQFSDKTVGSEVVAFIPEPDEDLYKLLRTLYYKQTAHFNTNKHYANRLEILFSNSELEAFKYAKTELYCTETMYEAVAISLDGKRKIRITQDGRIWTTPLK